MVGCGSSSGGSAAGGNAGAAAGGAGAGGGSSTGGSSTGGSSTGGSSTGGSSTGGVSAAGAGPVDPECTGTFGDPSLATTDYGDTPSSPTLPSGELELFYIQDAQTATTASRIVRSTRTATTPFGTPSVVSQLASACGTLPAESIDITEDGLRLYIACVPADDSQPRTLHLAQRSNPTSPFALASGTLGAVGISISVSADERTLYAVPPPSTNAAVAAYTRDSNASPFSGPVPIGVTLRNPEINHSGLELYGSDGTRIVVARRASVDAPFGTPTPVGLSQVPIGGLTDPVYDFTPAISADCRSLHFVRLEVSGASQFWFLEHATR
jgi:hypothetical protein